MKIQKIYGGVSDEILKILTKKQKIYLCILPIILKEYYGEYDIELKLRLYKEIENENLIIVDILFDKKIEHSKMHEIRTFLYLKHYNKILPKKICLFFGRKKT